MKKPFVVDYTIVGTLHLSCRNQSAAELRAASVIQRAMADLDDASVYCEPEISVPIDATERYLSKLRGTTPQTPKAGQ